MADTIRRDLKALHRLINQADLILDTIPATKTIASARENLSAALRLSKDILTRPVDESSNPAALLGSRGGSVTAQKGSDYFRELAAKRKTNGGGRPKKTA